jgi:exosome complex RNA-binding protein Rrp4
LMLSEEKEVVVEEKEYKQFHLGDIVQYESLSLERYISHAITLIDKISEVMQRDDIARSAEHDKV